MSEFVLQMGAERVKSIATTFKQTIFAAENLSKCAVEVISFLSLKQQNATE